MWWFVGQNQSFEPLQGRPEHTDQVVHDGTWHFQLAGSKVWRLRPTEEWAATAGRGHRSARRSDEGTRPHCIRCDVGDILLLSTRDWWHATQIPPQTSASECSVSYAREFNLRRSTDLPGAVADESPATFTNVDGLFASAAIPRGAIVMTEEDEGMEDVELPTSAEPNCEVVEDETGRQCLVARCAIRSGDFLTIGIG